jgi:hypothetical protein
MKGTALLVDEDHTVKIFENVGHEMYEELVSQKHSKYKHCTIGDKKIKLGPITKVVWYEDTVDWNYGY